MIGWNNFAIQTEINEHHLLYPEYTNHVESEMKRELAEGFIGKVELEKAYLIKLTSEHFRNPVNFSQTIRFMLSSKEVPQEKIEYVREYKFVEVEALEIENINCRNCAAPIPVGKLDLHGDTLVRCSYCGTYHTLRKKTKC